MKTHVFQIITFVFLYNISVSGVNSKWDGGGEDLSWCNPLNWQANQQPSNSDNAYLDSINGHTVIDPGCSAVCNSLMGPGYLAGPHKLEIKGGTLTTTYDDNYPWYIGNNSSGTVNISSGQVSCGKVYCGNGAGGSGLIDISGGSLSASGHILVSAESGSTGELRVSGSAVVNCGGIYACGPKGTGTFTVTGGTLNSDSAISVQMAQNTGSTAYWNMSGGLVDLAGEFWVSHYGSATVNMTGGELRAGNLYVPRVAEGYGIVNLDGGLIKVDNLYLRHNGGYGRINITEGILAVKHDKRSMLNAYIKDGFITAYNENPGAYFELDYNETIPGYTTLTAKLKSPYHACRPVPNRWSILTTGQCDNKLTWQPGDSASEHHVYIGTDYKKVKEADITDSEYQGIVYNPEFAISNPDPNRTYYWRVDEKVGTTFFPGPVWSFRYVGPHEPVYHYDLRYSQGLSPEKRYDIRHAVVCLQGLVNRKGPRLYLSFHNQDRMWLERLFEPDGLCENRSIHEIETIDELFQLFGSEAEGIIAYDPDPETGAISSSLAATTAAAVENAIAVRKDISSGSFYNYLKWSSSGPGYRVILDIAGKFTGTGTIWQTDTASTGSKKCDAYIWAKEKYIDTGRTDSTLISYSLDLWGLKVETDLWTQLSNLDYAIARKGFCLELSPWGDDIPNDDPGQPMGTDLNTFKAVLESCNVQNDFDKMIKCTGFVNFHYKYTTNVGDGHDGVSTEWELVRLLSAYNAYLEADAAAGSYVSNCSFNTWFRPEITGRRYIQNPAPTYEDMQARGLIDENGDVVDGNYILFCLGDYDQASWTTYYLAGERYDDSARGTVNCNWACNPNTSDRAMIAWDYMFRHKSDKDTFMAWDSGAGYVNPAQLHGTRDPSGYYDAVDLWRQHCKKYYRLFDYSISAWLINGHSEDMTYMDIANYAPFSGDGINLHNPELSVPFIRDNIAVTDMGHFDEPNWTNFINYNSGVHFRPYRSVLEFPSKIAELEQTWSTSGNNHRFLDAYTYFYLLRYYLGGSNDYRATWVSDDIPYKISAGETYPVSITVRNDGWDTWTEAGNYRLGYAIVPSGRFVLDIDYQQNIMFDLPAGVSVKPGEIVTFQGRIAAPSANGTYDLYYDMRSDAGGWFRDRNNIEWKMSLNVTGAEDIDNNGEVGLPDLISLCGNWIADNSQTAEICQGQKVAHWNFEENGGIITSDISGMGNRGFLQGCNWTDGKWGYGVSFNGTSDYIFVDDAPDLSFKGDFTISAWINPDYTGSAKTGIISKVLDTTQKEYALSMNGNKLQLDIEKDANNGVAKNEENVIIPSQWQHIAAVVESSTYAVKFYYNGQPLKTAYNSINGFTSSIENNLNIGRWGGTYNSKYYAGRMDDVRIYNYRLDKEQIERVYQGLEPLHEQVEICENRPVGDLNGDCKVTIEDFSMLSEKWFTADQPF